MVLRGDALTMLSTIDSEIIQTCVTSPPYWGLRDYGVEGQIGLEKTPEEYIDKMVEVFREVRRVLRRDGTLWLNLGDSYAGGMSRGDSGFTSKQASNKGSTAFKGRGPNVPKGLKPKDLCGIPWRVALALQSDGWYLRQDIIWHKPNPMPESVRDRCTKAHEYIFLLSKSPKYYFDINAIKEPSAEFSRGRSRPRSKLNGTSTEQAMKFGLPNQCQITPFRQKRSVWSVTTKSYKGAHFATFPPDLIEPCILAGSRPGDIVLDPFFGAGTTGVVATKNSRKYIGIELNQNYIEIALNRLKEIQVEAVI